MRIRPADKIDEKQNIKGDLTEYVFFIVLNLLVVPFSAYQTFVGYQKDVAGHWILALVVALISAVLFAAMNFGIRSSRLKGEKHHLKILMYIVPLGMSFFGNFNAFYANQMREALLRKEISDYRLTLTTTKNVAVSEIEKSVDIPAFRRDYDLYETALKTEFGKYPEGWGKNCEQRWKDLCSFLSSKGGSLLPNVVSSYSGDVKYNRALNFALGERNAILSSKQSKIVPVLISINESFDKQIINLDSLTSLSKPVFSSKMLDDMVIVENTIRTEAESFLGSKTVFSHQPLKSSNENEIGTIKHSLNSAFVKKESPTATAFSLFLSLIIDFAALLYIVVFIPYNKVSKTEGRINSNGPKRI
jgi:hypothetical protein